MKVIYIVIPIAVIFLMQILFTIITNFKSEGEIGEDIVKTDLSELNEEEYKVINNVLLKRKNGRTSQIDHVVISPYGIFVIETKNYKGTIIGTDEDREWIQKIGKYRNKFYNPVKQNIGHINALKELLKEYANVLYVSIVVFTTSADLSVSRSNNLNSHICYCYKVVDIIKKYSKKILSDTEVLDIYKTIKENNISSYKQRKIHIQNVKNYVKEVEVRRKENYPWF
ncbi:hypothetical protein TR13x_03915 [Caloranaerobacter sp. TR13]|nr:hypothetical protein TR13x_03915 [Caloranaerobacter sp. TR13]